MNTETRWLLHPRCYVFPNRRLRLWYTVLYHWSRLIEFVATPTSRYLFRRLEASGAKMSEEFRHEGKR